MTALRNYVAQRNNTPQTTRAREDQVVNNAGGYVFTVDDRGRLERFLILGTEKGTYYASEQKLTEQNADFLKALIAKDERLVVDTIVDVSVNGRAYRQSPALFALALVLTHGNDKAYAREAFDKVVRTSTHLFETAEYIDGLGGWGRAKRKAFAGWYENKSADQLAYQAVKYRQRNGWTHRDVLRLSHAKPDALVAGFMLGKTDVTDLGLPAAIAGFQEMQMAMSVNSVVDTLKLYPNLPWETIPTQFLTDARVWKTLFYNGQLQGQALIRNITRLAKNGAFKDVQFAGDVAIKLADQEMIERTRLHPINFLNALGIYRSGQLKTEGWHGRRIKEWDTNPKILGSLEAGFYASFKNVEPANKRTLLAIDTSGSMTWWGPAGLVGMDCREAAAAMAMVAARTEPYVEAMACGTSRHPLELSATDSLAEVQRKIDRLPGAGTDLALPMQYAKADKREFDTFAIYTDNETWAGGTHPFQALKQYRQVTGIDAKLAVVGMTSTEFTIADPSDRGMMDFVGFDSNAPRVMADFSAGRL